MNEEVMGGTESLRLVCNEPINEPINGPIQNKLPYNVTIKALNYGYVVEIGCQSFAIESNDKLIENLSKYLKNPKDVEKMWFNGELL